MRPETLSLLCNPYNGEELHFENNTLIGVESKRIYPIIDGIPRFLSDNHLSGRSKWFRGFYDSIAFAYDSVENLGNALSINSEGFVRSHYIGDLNIKPGEKVLETSVGTASNLFFMPPEGDYYGTDISMQMLKRAKKKLQHGKRTAELFQADGEYLPFKENSFDLVLQMGGLQFYSNPKRGLVEMARVAKRGTTIHVLDEKRSIKGVLRRYDNLKDRTISKRSLSDLHQLIPHGMGKIQHKILFESDFYLLTFSKP